MGVENESPLRKRNITETDDYDAEGEGFVKDLSSTKIKLELIVDLGNHSVPTLNLDVLSERDRMAILKRHPELYLHTKPKSGVPILPPKWTFGRFLEVIVDTIAVIVGILVWVGKCTIDGTLVFSPYLTNWTWCVLTIYFTLRLLCYLDSSGTMLYFLDYFFVWPIQITVWAVMFLVVIILWYAPELMTGMFLYYDAGKVIAGERLFHVFTFVVYEFHLILSLKEHQIMLHRTLASWIRFFIWVVIAAHCYIFVYYLNNDFQYVYNLHHHISTAAIIGFYELFAVFIGGFLCMVVASPLDKISVWAFVYWSRDKSLNIFCNFGTSKHDSLYNHDITINSKGIGLSYSTH